MSQLSEFVYKLQITRPDFLETITEEEQKVLGEHFAYLQGLLAEGRLILAGPCLDAAFGICVYRAESLEEATAIMERDPVVVHGVMTAEVHAFRVSLLEGRDTV
jgi:uncharacterized protein YciI